MIGVNDSETRLVRVLGDSAAQEARSTGSGMSLDAAAQLAKQAP